MRVERQTVDMSGFPDLVVVYLGMRVRRPRGLLRLLGIGPQIQRSWKEQPDGLLLHEDLIWSLLPPHLGMRQYWRDIDSLERWTRSEPHQRWWRNFLRDSGGTGFWHEAYFVQGGVEAIYDDMAAPMGFARFAPAQAARGAMFSATTASSSSGPADRRARDQRGRVLRRDGKGRRIEQHACRVSAGRVAPVNAPAPEPNSCA
jgi:hypothetical protein